MDLGSLTAASNIRCFDVLHCCGTSRSLRRAQSLEGGDAWRPIGLTTVAWRFSCKGPLQGWKVRKNIREPSRSGLEPSPDRAVGSAPLQKLPYLPPRLSHLLLSHTSSLSLSHYNKSVCSLCVVFYWCKGFENGVSYFV